MKLFKTVKVIKSKDGELHFTRYAIIETKWFAVYIHRIYLADEDKHLHNHPWAWTWAKVLKGFYTEEQVKTITFKDGSLYAYTEPELCGRSDALSPSKMTPGIYHKIKEILRGPVVSLFVTGRRLDGWGYLVEGKHVGFKEYRLIKNTGGNT